MSNKKYVIVTDLDGTFFASDSNPAPSNLPAIEAFKANGGYFTIATGRYSIKWAKLANAPVILCNGAFMYDSESGQVINERTFDGAPVYEILRDVHAKFPGPSVRYTDSRDIHYLFRDGIKDDCGDRWYKVVFESAATHPRDTQYKRADLSDICTYLQDKYGDRFRYNFSSPGLFEVLQQGASKGICIGDLRKYFADKGVETIICAVGDYENDAEMLEAADIAVCPSNALPCILDYVGKREEQGTGIIAADNNTGTIADLISRLQLASSGL